MNLITRVRNAAVVCLALGSLHAQQSPLRIPLTGFVLDPQSHAIVPITGLLGAAQLGEPLALPVAVGAAEFFPSGDYAIVIAGNARDAILVRSLTANPYLQVLDGVIASVDQIAIDPSAAVALLYSDVSHQLQFISGLPDQPRLSASISLDSIPGRVTALTIAASGQSALVAASDGSSGGIYEIQIASAPRLLVSAFQPSAVLYMNGDRDIAYADSFSHEVLIVRDARERREVRAVASAADHVLTPVALRWVGGALLVADSGSGSILKCDLMTGTTSMSGPLPVAPMQLQGILLSNMFVINEPGSGPLYVYSSVDSSLIFVPPHAKRQAVEGRRR